MHTAAHYDETGGSVSVSIREGAQRPGLTLAVAPRRAPPKGPAGRKRSTGAMIESVSWTDPCGR